MLVFLLFKTAKTKTSFVLKNIEDPEYERKPPKEFLMLNKYECKVVIIARFGMLECGKNYKGTLPLTCTICNSINDEEHRLNI